MTYQEMKKQLNILSSQSRYTNVDCDLIINAIIRVYNTTDKLNSFEDIVSTFTRFINTGVLSFIK